MAKKDLFCIKTDNGYGLFQEYDSYPNWFNEVFYVVYYTQVKELSEVEITQALQSEYYYERISINDKFGNGFSKEQLLNNKNVEYSAKDFGIEDNCSYYGKCYITYLGKYDLPLNVEIPKFSRKLDLSKITGKHKWFIHNEICDRLEKNERGKLISYKTVKDEIKSYPRYYGAFPVEILKRFNAGYRQCNDDEWENIEMEEYYQQHPDLRPIKLNYEDVKFPLPTEEMRRMIEVDREESDKQKYKKFCDEVESLCTAFLNRIERDKKSTRKHLITIVEELNKLYDKTGLIETMEAEIIYTYLANILKSLRKNSLIEIIEDKRNW